MKYDGAAGQVMALVKVPSISSSTVIYVHYGNGSISQPTARQTAVWDSYYTGVWNLADTEGTVNDFTSGGHTGTPRNNPSVGAIGTATAV